MANVARIIVRFGLVENTLLPNIILHVKTVDGRGPIDATDREALGVATSDWWQQDGASYGKLASVYPGDITQNEAVITRVQPDESDDTLVPLGGFAGTYQNIPNVGRRVMLPPQVCFMIGLRTTEDTRRGRGRIYMPAFLDIAEVIGQPPADAIALGLISGNEVMAHMGSRIAEAYFNTPGYDPGTFVLCVYSKVAATSHAVTHFSIPQHARTQRRRALHPSPHSVYGLDGLP